MNETMPTYCAHLTEQSTTWHSVVIHGRNYRLCDACYEELSGVLPERGLIE